MEGKDICFFTVIQCFLKDFTILALRKWKVVSSLTLTVGDFFLSGCHFGIWRLLHIWEKSSFMDLMFSFLTLKISKNFEFVFKIFQPTCRPKKKKKKEGEVFSTSWKREEKWGAVSTVMQKTSRCFYYWPAHTHSEPQTSTNLYF